MIVITVLGYGFFVKTVSADNNIFLIPGTKFYSGTDACSTRLKEEIAKINKMSGISSDEREKLKDQAESDNSKTCYEFLEPLPAVDSSGNAAEATAIEITPTEGISGTFNNMYGMAIGIGSVLAVIMIALYGFRYMSGNKSVYENGKLKEKITNVVLGLLLLLGIYVILNTINPRLLDVQPEMTSVNLQALDIEQGDGFEPSDTGDIPSVGAKTLACEGGMKQVKGIYVCTSIAKDLENLINDAQKSKIVLGGFAYRSTQRQEELRNKHCGCSGNRTCIYEKSAGQCSPPTAKPGRSRHESGLAIDFTCGSAGVINVTKRPATKVCFDWLKSNAKKHNLYNLASENWHWSIDGK